MTDEEDALADARVLYDLGAETEEAVARLRPELRTKGAKAAADGFALMGKFLKDGAEAIIERAEAQGP